MITTTLPIGASAEPNTCGSCAFFDRLLDSFPSGRDGRCKFKFPPHVATKYDVPGKTPENSYEYERTIDTSRCDLYRADGRRYITQRMVGP